MIVACPACERNFRIPDTAFDKKPEGRNLKCGGCGHTWFQKKPEEAPAPEIPEENENIDLEALEKLLVKEEDKKEELIEAVHKEKAEKEQFEIIEEEVVEKAGILSWALFGLILLLIVPSLMILARHHIVRYYPKMAPFYNYVGLKVAVPNRDFHFQNTSWSEVMREGVPALDIKGEIRYQPREELARAVPHIQAFVYDRGPCEKPGFFKEMFEGRDPRVAEGLCLKDTWIFRTADNLAMPGESIPFEFIRIMPKGLNPSALSLEFVSDK